MSRFIVTVDSYQQMEKFNKFEAIERYIVGDNHFGLRLSTSFNLEEITRLTELAHQAQKKIFIAITKIFHENELEKLEKYIEKLKKIDIDGIIFSDFAVFQIIKANKLTVQTLYSTDTTITNASFTTLAVQNNINEVELAKEITLKEILAINEVKKVPVTVAIHGHIYMYHSSRPLILNYLENQKNKGKTKLDADKLLNQDLYLFDKERQNYYPIAQNETDTHVLSSEDFCGIKFIPELKKSGIDFLKLDGFGYKSDDFTEIVELYNQVLNENITDKKTLEQLKDKISSITSYRKYGNGFFQKATVY